VVKEVQRCCIVMVPEQRVHKVQHAVCKPVCKEVEHTYTVCVPVWKEVEQQYTVMVPHQEQRQGVRRVCRMIEEEVEQTVCVDRGHWETQMVEVPCYSHRGCWRGRRCGHGCGGCGGCGSCGGCCQPCTRTVCRQVWVPNVVQEVVKVKCCKPQIVEEPYAYMVTVCKPEVRVRKVRVCEYQQEPRTVKRYVTTYETEIVEREVTYTVCVPKKKMWTEQVTCYQSVPEEVVRDVTVCVPHQVEKEVVVKVCRMVPKCVQVPVTNCCCRRRCCRGC
jgi:hypothetical protein